MCGWMWCFHLKILPQRGHGYVSPLWIDFMCTRRLPFSAVLYSQCGHGNFWPSYSWAVFMCFWRTFVFTISTCESFSFMICFNVFVKTSFLCESGLAMGTFKCFPFVNCIHVFLQISSALKLLCTLRAIESFPFMNTLYMLLKVAFQCCPKITMRTWQFYPLLNWWIIFMCLWRPPLLLYFCSQLVIRTRIFYTFVNWLLHVNLKIVPIFSFMITMKTDKKVSYLYLDELILCVSPYCIYFWNSVDNKGT